MERRRSGWPGRRSWPGRGAARSAGAGDPLRLHWQDLSGLPRLSQEEARELAGQGAGPNRLTEGLLWLVLEEAPDFAGQGVLLLDLMQEAAVGLLQAMEDPGPDPVERGRWSVRQAMARAVALQYLATGEAQRLVAAMRAYQQADRRLLERLGRNPGPEELAQELGKPVVEILALEKMVRDAAAGPDRVTEPPQEQKVEDTAYFQLRTQVEALLSSLDDLDRALLRRRFGLDGRTPQGLEEAARALGLDPAEAARREQAAMDALRRQGL